MKLYVTSFLIFISALVNAQELNENTKSQIVLTPEILIGITGEANEGFADRKLQKQFITNIGWIHSKNQQEWAKRFKAPRTGISVAFTDFGNSKELGYAVSILPFIEINAFKSKRLKIHMGTGVSYFTKKYDSLNNPRNEAVSTDLAWSLRLFSYYNILKTKTLDWRAGVGYFHHSNGHSRIPNQGFNSFLFSISADIKNPRNMPKDSNETPHKQLQKSRYNYFSVRAGYGLNALSRSFEDKKNVFTVSGEYGRVYNNIIKVGLGFYYRFYQNYYDYISNNESLVQLGREFEDLKKNPTWNASNIGVFIKGELLLNHIGIDLQLGFNLHKPGYQIDWRINQGWDYVPQNIPENSNIVLGEFDSYYEIKKLISTRLGLKYYLIGTEKLPKTNFYIGAFINANLGQADFSEIAIGYVYNFKKKI